MKLFWSKRHKAYSNSNLSWKIIKKLRKEEKQWQIQY